MDLAKLMVARIYGLKKQHVGQAFADYGTLGKTRSGGVHDV